MKELDVISLARKHSIKKDNAAADFFEGALLGNGGLGVVACTRPDALVLHLGHNSIWDIRIEEGHKEKIGTFNEIWSKIISSNGNFVREQWYHDYFRDVTASYLGYEYPRPYPASSLYLFFDRKEYEILGHTLDISDGLLSVELQNNSGENYYIQVFVSQESDTVYCRTVDENGNPTPIFHRMNLAPHNPDAGLPPYTVLENGFRQPLPALGFDGQARKGIDKGFSVLYKTDGTVETPALKSKIHNASEFVLEVTEGFLDRVEQTSEITDVSFDEAISSAKKSWEEYWNCSAVALEDEFLEHLWYTNTYFIRCILNENSTCPGLFGNWMHENIGVAWHGDYHMNYNTQQIFWGLMGANRLGLHLPYVKLAEDLLPLSKSWATEFYSLPGACYPHSAYPVPMTTMPYPSPDWGWEILETPWSVQSLWWHYTYTKDLNLLRERLYPVIREAALFLVGYMTREGSDPKGDGKYHLFPTIVPELYGLTADLKKNIDGVVDATLTKFVFHAVLDAVKDLGLEKEEAELTGKIKEILAAFPEYPTANSRWGEMFITVETEDPENTVYNCPANMMQVFPGEDIDAQTATEREMEIAKNSWYHHYNEGGNDLVFYHLIGARLGIIDLEKFKRHVRYCLLPNETATDRLTTSGGRHWDERSVDFMSYMGVWVENFSLYAVVNECLIWGHRDIIELFPNWDKNKAASFRSMRTKGAFLIDSSCSGGEIEYVRILSEKGGEMKLKNPWVTAIDQNGNVYDGAIISVNMAEGEKLLLRPQ